MFSRPNSHKNPCFTTFFVFALESCEAEALLAPMSFADKPKVLIIIGDASETVDTDGDGTGNNADTDDDNDDVVDASDAFPLDATESVDTDMDGSDDIENYTGAAPDIGAFEFEEDDCGIAGDINMDSNVNILDIINVANCILGDCQDPCADLNGDGSINILDIINLVNIILSF